MSRKEIFRREALAAHVEGEGRGTITRIARPMRRVIFFSVAGLFAAMLVLGVVARVDVNAEGRGVVRPRGGLLTVRAPAAGIVRSVAHEGEAVANRGVVVTLDVGGREPLEVTSAVAGEWVEAAVREGSQVLAGEPLGALIPEGEPLVGYLALPEHCRPYIAPERSVRLRIDAYPYQEMGAGSGRLVHVGGDLLSEDWRRQIERVSGDSRGDLVLVEVSLDQLPKRAPGGWQNGMAFTGQVVLRQKRALSVVFPPLETILGD